MANLATYLQTVQDFINRVAPFDGNPLIQKSEDLTVRQLLANSVLFKEGTTTSINSPGAAFACNFASTDEFDIDTSASIGSAFAITFSGLENNRVGKLNITKKSGDVISFVNGSAVPVDLGLNSQVGLTTLKMLVFQIGGSYFVFPQIEQYPGNFTDLTLINGAIEAPSAALPTRRAAGYMRYNGMVYLTGAVEIGGGGSIIAQLPAGFRPKFNWVLSTDYVETPSAFPRIDTSGNIDAAGGTGVFMLNGISFPLNT